MKTNRDLSMKTIIVDDERLARKELKKLLENYEWIEIIDEAENGEEAVEKINQHKPDLVFLDIQMPEMDGFEVLNHLDVYPLIVFVTAYDEYAAHAFDVDAFDYLLKPIEHHRLQQLMDKLIKFKMQALTSHIQGPGGVLSIENFVFIKDGDNCWFVQLKDIRYFESDGNYIKVFFDNHKPMILKSLNQLIERLDGRYFFRASRKHIINLLWVEKIEVWYNGGFIVTLKSGEKIEISRRQGIKLKYQLSL